jgi:hypothetical protein
MNFANYMSVLKGRVCSGRYCAIKGTGTVRADRAHSAGRLARGVAVVAVSPTEGWGGPGPIGGPIIVGAQVGSVPTF